MCINFFILMLIYFNIGFLISKKKKLKVLENIFKKL